MRGSLLRDGSIFHGGGMSRLGLVITHAQSRCDDAFKRTYTRTRVRPQARQGGGGRGSGRRRLGSRRIVLPRRADPRGVIDHELPGLAPDINHRAPARP